jgi:hypothetical protein
MLDIPKFSVGDVLGDLTRSYGAIPLLIGLKLSLLRLQSQRISQNIKADSAFINMES